MKINISEDAMGFRVKLSASAKPDFEILLAHFKSRVPAKCRSYQDGYWFVHRRSEHALTNYLDAMARNGATVEQGGVEQVLSEYPKPEPSRLIQIAPVTDEEPLSESEIKRLLKRAATDSYLTIEDGQEMVELLHSAKRRQSNEPHIVLRKCPRWYSLHAHLFGPVLTDEARNKIFQILLAASLPGGSVRASNRTVTASRLPLAVGVQVCQCLTAFLFDSQNREHGAAREHGRWEARKQGDGEIRFLQRGTDRRESGKAA